MNYLKHIPETVIIMKKKIDLRNCKHGDILISTQGVKLEYISPTPWNEISYLDHVVRYIEDENGNSFGRDNYGTRTHDGFVFQKNRIPETDHDIALICNEGWAIDVTNKKATHYYKGGKSLCGRELEKEYFDNFDKSIDYTQILGSTCGFCHKN